MINGFFFFLGAMTVLGFDDMMFKDDVAAGDNRYFTVVASFCLFLHVLCHLPLFTPDNLIIARFRSPNFFSRQIISPTLPFHYHYTFVIVQLYDVIISLTR